jgi:hypothetical protein
MIITMHEDSDGGFEMWVGLEGSDPRADAFGFMVGQGETREAAIEDGTREMARALGEFKTLELARAEWPR